MVSGEPLARVGARPPRRSVPRADPLADADAGLRMNPGAAGYSTGARSLPWPGVEALPASSQASARPTSRTPVRRAGLACPQEIEALKS